MHCIFTGKKQNCTTKVQNSHISGNELDNECKILSSQTWRS